MEFPIETETETQPETINTALETRRTYMREYMKKKYHEDLEKSRGYKNSLKYKTRFTLPAEDLKEYGVYLADIYKLRKLKEKLPSVLWEKCLTDIN
jgi:hypothetical protein